MRVSEHSLRVCAGICLLPATTYLRTAVIWFFIANEGLSALENMGRLGVPLPEFLKQSLQKLNKGNVGR